MVRLGDNLVVKDHSKQHRVVLPGFLLSVHSECIHEMFSTLDLLHLACTFPRLDAQIVYLCVESRPDNRLRLPGPSQRHIRAPRCPILRLAHVVTVSQRNQLLISLSLRSLDGFVTVPTSELSNWMLRIQICIKCTKNVQELSIISSSDLHYHVCAHRYYLPLRSPRALAVSDPFLSEWLCPHRSFGPEY
jgi:hypothetical protein